MKLTIRLLMVEDEPMQARWVGDRLAADGIECLTVVVDREAPLRRALEEATFDLAICDYRLPDYDGLAALKLIRASAPGLPIIFMSSEGHEELVAECFRAGATDYVIKSKPARFAPTVMRALAAARQTAEREELMARLAKLGAQIPGVLFQARLRTDGAAHFPFVGERVRDLFKLTPADLRSDIAPLIALMLPEDVENFTRSLRESAGLLQPWKHECRWRDDAGVVRWLAVTATPEREPAGGVLWHGLITEITERRELDASLAEMRDKALEASRLKSEFLANMSHEIRTPMNGIIGMTALMLKGELSPQQHEMTDIIRRSGESLLVIINEILDFSKIEAGRFKIDRARFALGSMVQDTCLLLDATARQKGIKLTCELGVDLEAEFVGDGPRIRQVLTNLVGNAIKFTHSGEVLVSAGIVCSTPECDTVRIEVQDSGVGIPREAQAHLFQPFTQGDGSTTRSFGGTGLGLAISLRLVELMGGVIDFESTVGEGSTFWFEVPLVRGLRHAARLHDGRVAGWRTLVVAEDEDRRRSLIARLRALRIVAEEATSAVGAVHRLARAREGLEEQGFDLMIVLDDLTDVTAEELAVLVHADGAYQHLRVVLAGPRAKTERGVFDAVWSESIEVDAMREWMLRWVPAFAQEVAEHAAGLESERGFWANSSRPPAPERRLRLLLVEDNYENQIVARMLVDWLGHRVQVVDNGAKALEALQGQAYDAVLMDCHMPVLDGFGATRRIRSGDVPGVDRMLPIIALTANAMPADRARCLEAGMTDYVSKPIDPDELLAAFSRCGLTLAAPNVIGTILTPEWGGGTKAAELKTSEDWDPRPVRVFESMTTRDGESLATTMVRLFLADTEHRLLEVERCLAVRDADLLEHVAHKLAGSAANLGAFLMRDALREVENMAADFGWGGIPPQIARTRESWLRLKPQLADYVKSLTEISSHESSDR